MDHPNIIKMHDVYENPSELFIVMEVCAGGELFDRIKEQPDGNYSENDAADVLRQIAEGLKYLHSHKIAHCDLKPDNFLFLSREKNAALKIIVRQHTQQTHTTTAVAHAMHSVASPSLFVFTFANFPVIAGCVCACLSHVQDFGMSKWVKRRKYFKSL